MREVAEVLVMDKTTVSRNLAGLLELGFIVCRPGPDARVKLVSCTAKGHKAFTTAVPLWKKAQAGIERRLGRSAFAKTVSQARRLARTIANPACRDQPSRDFEIVPACDCAAACANATR